MASRSEEKEQEHTHHSASKGASYDFEKLQTLCEEKQKDNPVLSLLTSFPEDDVALRQVPHVSKTASLTTEFLSEKNSDLPRAVADAERCYSSGFIIVNHPHTNDGKGSLYADPRFRASLEPLHTIVPAQQQTSVRLLTTSSGEKPNFRGSLALGSKGDSLPTEKDKKRRTLHQTKSVLAGLQFGRESKNSQPVVQEAGSLASVGKMKSLRVTPPLLLDRTRVSVSIDSGLDKLDEEAANQYDEVLMDRINKPDEEEPWKNARPSLAHVYPVRDFSVRNSLTTIEDPKPFGSVPTAHICVEIRQLRFESCDFEPLYGTLFLYNKTAGCITSEPFHFCVSPDHIHFLVGKEGDRRKRATAVFSVPLPSLNSIATDPTKNANLDAVAFEEYLILRVDKVAMDETLSTVADAYSKPEGSLEGDVISDLGKKLNQAARDHEKVYGRLLTETIAWSCAPIMTFKLSRSQERVTNGLFSVDVDVVGGEQSFSTFYKHNPTEPDMISLVINGSSRKAGQLRASCTFKVSNLESLNSLCSAPRTLVVDSCGRQVLSEEGKDLPPPPEGKKKHKSVDDDEEASGKLKRTKSEKKHRSHKNRRSMMEPKTSTLGLVREYDKPPETSAPSAEQEPVKLSKKSRRKSTTMLEPKTSSRGLADDYDKPPPAEQEQGKLADLRKSQSVMTSSKKSRRKSTSAIIVEPPSPVAQPPPTLEESTSKIWFRNAGGIKLDNYDRVVEVLRHFDETDALKTGKQNSGKDGSAVPSSSAAAAAAAAAVMSDSSSANPPSKLPTELSVVSGSAAQAAQMTVASVLSKSTVLPYTDMEHTLFLSIKQLTLPFIGSSLFKQNRVWMKIELIQEDPRDKTVRNALSCFCGSDFCSTDNEQAFGLSKEAVTCISPVSSKVALFSDMIKVRPPHALSSSLFLLFTIMKKGEKEPIGYAYTPLFYNSELVSGINRSLSVERQRPKSLSMGFAQQISQPPGTEQLSSLKLSMTWYTTLYSMDSCIQRFFSSLDMPKKIHMTLDSIANASPEALTVHFPVILNELFGLMCASKQLEDAAFAAVLKVLDVIWRSSQLWSMLFTTYTECAFSPSDFSFSEVEPDMVQLSLHAIIARCWSRLLNNPNSVDLGDISCRFSSFLFNVMMRSMYSDVYSYMRTISPLSSVGPNLKVNKFIREKLSIEPFRTDLKNLMVLLTQQVPAKWGEKLSSIMCGFCIDLFSVLDRGLVSDIVKQFINDLVPFKTNDGKVKSEDNLVIRSKFKFLHLLTQYENFVVLNLPLLSSSETKRKNSHFFVDILLKQIDMYMAEQYSEDMRVLCLATLQDSFIRFDVDERYCNNKEVIATIADMYIPFLKIVISHKELYNKEHSLSSAQLRRLAMFCLAWVLKNCHRDKLVEWFHPEHTLRCRSRIKTLIEAMTCCVKTFRCDQKKPNHGSRPNGGSAPQWPAVDDPVLDYYLNSEISLVIVEVMKLFRHNERLNKAVEDDSDADSFKFVDSMLSLLTNLLDFAGSRELVCHIYSLLHVFISNTRSTCRVLFTEHNNICGELCRIALRHCNSFDGTVRSNAVAFLYYMMFNNYETVAMEMSLSGNNVTMTMRRKQKGKFNRMKIQMMKGMSKLGSQGVLDVKSTQRALNTLMVYNKMKNIRKTSSPASGVPTSSTSPLQQEASIEVDDGGTPDLEGPSSAPSSGPSTPVGESTPKGTRRILNISPPPFDAAASSSSGSLSATSSSTTPSSSGHTLKTVLRNGPTQSPESCVVCGSLVYALDRATNGEGKVAHLKCLRCAKCDAPLTAEDASRPINEKLYCREHFTELARRSIGVDSFEQPAAIVPPVTSITPRGPVERTKSLRRFHVVRHSSRGNISSPLVPSGEDSAQKEKEPAASEDSVVIGNPAVEDPSDEYNSFGKEILQLVKLLKGIIEDGMKLNTMDKELRADLYWSIANRYTSVPVIRLEWLDTLYKFNKEQGLQIEAANTLLLECAYVADYLYQRARRDNFVPQYLPLGFRAFREVAPAVCEDARISSSWMEDESVIDSTEFTENGLMNLMERAVHSLRDAELHEMAYRLMLLLLPMYDHNHQYDKLRNFSVELCKTCESILVCQKPGNRQLGSYYRIGLYGQVFGEQNGKEYITRFLKLTRLAEVMNELTTMYKSCFGTTFARTGGEIKFIRESGPVPNSLTEDPINAHIQITSVTPFFGFEQQEREKIAKTEKPREAQIKIEQMIPRDTLFDSAFNINCFMYETPFTKGAKDSHYDDDAAKQWKRQTFLFLDNDRLMPFVKQRMLVVNRQKVELTPIENAIDTVNLQTSRLRTEVEKSVPDVKSLQPLLQGSCLVMVQKGMVEGICSSFLSKNADDFPKECIARLIVSTEEFVKAVEAGIRLHLTIVPSEMEQMHMELEKGFRRLRNEVNTLIAHAREEWDLLDDADLDKAARSKLILTERITPVSQFISGTSLVSSEHSPASSPHVSLRATRPLQRRMSVSISPRVGFDGTITLTDRLKRKRADSIGGGSPSIPASATESSLNVSFSVATDSDVEEEKVVGKKQEEVKKEEDEKNEEEEVKKDEEKHEEKKPEEEKEEEIKKEDEKKPEEKKEEEDLSEESDEEEKKDDESEKKEEKPKEKKDKDKDKEKEKKKVSQHHHSSSHSGSHHHRHSSSHHSRSPHPHHEESSKHHREKSGLEPKSPRDVDPRLRKSHRKSMRSMRKSCVADPVTTPDSPTEKSKSKKVKE